MDEKVAMTSSFDPTPELRDALGLRDRKYVGFETLYVKPTVDEASAAGNRRAERTCRYVYDKEICAWRCSECGGLEPVGDHVRYCPDCGARVVG